MSYFSRWDRGDWDAICDSCGRKFKASKLKQRWDGLMVDSLCWEPRQPQDLVRGVPDPQLVPWVRDEATDTYDLVCTLVTQQASADYGTADCAQADFNQGYLPGCTTDGNSCVSGFAVSGCSISGYIPMGWDLTL